MNDCPRCGGSNARDARFCMDCGAALDRACAACAEPLPAAAKFCPSCGAPAHARSAPVEMIKLVTIMFADVVGSTAHAEQMSPEDTRALMAEFFEAMMAEIDAEGGTVERLIGDAIMADFGVPVAREDDALRAVRAALRMFERLERFNVGRPPGTRIQMRIGINTGDVSTGGSLGERLMVMGDAVNVAARLEESAEPGSVVIGERTARAVRREFELQPLPPLHLKGKSEPVGAFLVGEPKGRRSGRDFLAPMFGRETELNVLSAALERVAHEGKPLIVTVLGDAGMGKSRLVSEFVRSVSGHTKILKGRCLPYGEGVTLWPFREILRDEIGMAGSQPTDVVAAKIRARVASIPSDLAPDPDRAAGAFAATIGLEGAAGPLADMDPREVYREIVQAWHGLLANIARDVPVVVVVEDLYWADETTLDLLKQLSELRTGSVLFIGPVRSEFTVSHADWIAGLKNYAALTLDPLDQDASARLLESLLGPEGMVQPVAGSILGKAEGNPFYLEEIVQRLIDDGSLVRSNGSWAIARDVRELDVPDNVQSVVLSRIDLLDAPQKQALQAAAVVGRNFWPGAVQQVTDLEDVEGNFEVLRRRNLIEERMNSTVPGEKEYAFRHILIRDVAYETLPRAARGRGHAAVAEWIIRTRGERAGEVAELLAHHYDEAFRWLADDGLRRQARDRYLEAAASAVRRFAIGQAENLGQRALDLSLSGPERIMALEALGDVFLLTFKSDRAWESYRAALSESERAVVVDPLVVARLASKASIVPTRWRGTMETLVPTDEIAALIETGLAAAPSVGRERALLTASRACLFALLREQGALDDVAEGEREAHRAIETAELLGDPELLSVGIDVASMWLMNDGRYGELSELDKRRVELAPRLKDVREASDAYAMVAASSYSIGRYPEALEHATRCVARSRGLDAGSYLHGLVWRVCAGFMAGRWDESRNAHAEIARLQADQANELPTNLVMWAHGTAFLCSELRGDADEADRCLALIERFNERRSAEGRDFRSYLGAPARALSHRGEHVRARAWLRTERSFYSGSHLEALCEVVGDQADWAVAADVVETARAEAASCGLAALAWFADRLAAREAAARGAAADAARLARRSAEGFAELGAPWEAARSWLLVAEAEVTRGNVDAARNGALLAQAEFDRLGSVRELQRSEKLLAELGF